MAEATSPAPTRIQYYVDLAGRMIGWALATTLGLLIAVQLVFFAIHAEQLLGYPYPLDYGEGPLLAQVDLLRSGTPLWRLYTDPDRAPYAVVNYPPVYHLTALLAALPLGNALLAGRLIALGSALAAVVALWLLSNVQTFKRSNVQTLIVLAFLALPIVREWSVVMRVDMLGVCLGLWGLVIVQRNHARRAVLWAALPLLLSLLVKPSLIAAPAAALLWLLFRDWRRALVLGGLIGLGGALAVALLQIGSGGWFLLHVLAANANAWDAKLAYGFWHDQMVILWPLAAAAVLSVVLQVAGRRSQVVGYALTPHLPSPICHVLLPLYYTLFGAIVAFGVGKVGAYTNYFLEFYAGLIWLAALVAGRRTKDNRPASQSHRRSSIIYRRLLDRL